MRIAKNRLAKKVAAALGSRRVERVPAATQGPLDLVHLRAFVQDRLKSSGGRPTDPDWTLSRQIPFQPERWQELTELAERLSREQDKSVSPGQLAAFFVEEGLSRMKRQAR